MNRSRPFDRLRAVVAVHVLLLRHGGGEVLLLRRFNTGYADGQYSVVAGHLEGGERVQTAAAREALEEIGVHIDESGITVVGVMHRTSDEERIDFFVTADTWRGEVRNMEPDKCDELRWVSVGALPDSVIPYIRRGIENYRTGRSFDAFGWE